MKNTELNGLTCFNFKKNVNRSELSSELNILILESDSTPDYYAKQNFPPNKSKNEMHLYIPIKKHVNCFQDAVLRETCKFNINNKLKIHISPGQINFKNKNYQAIRIKGHEAKNLPKLLKDLEKLGIEYMKDTKANEYESTIFFKKYTEFTKLEENVYQDKNNPFRYFFSISNLIDLDEFLEGIISIKNSCNFHMFDSFLSYTFTKHGVQDFIGIYSDHCDENRFGDLKKQIKIHFNK